MAKTNSKQKILQEAFNQKQKIVSGLGNFVNMVAENKPQDEFIRTSNDLQQIEPPPPPIKDKYNPDGIHDIITFCEHPYYLGIKLYPWQKLILKIFYMGTPGNNNLKIDNEVDEVGCKHCVWEYNRELEENFVKAVKNKELAPTNVMYLENSPCLNCKRCDPEIIQYRFKYALEHALTDNIKNKILEIQNRELQDRYENEEHILKNDLSSNVYQQVEKKIGLPFTELILVLGRRSGKALAIDTPIITPNGWTTMEKLKVGDYVFGEDGLPTKIIAVSDVMENRPCYKIFFSNNDTIVADENHEWEILIQNNKNEYIKTIKTTKEILESLNEQKNIFIETCKPLQFNTNISVENSPYIIGRFLANYAQKNSVHNLHLLQSQFEQYLRSTLKIRLEILKGYIESSNIITNKYSYVTYNKKIADMFYELVIGLGINAKFYKHFTMLNSNDKYEITFTLSNDMIKLLQSPRNIRSTKNIKPDKISIIKIIKLEDSVPVKCIQVNNESNLYLAGKSMIPTHNSFMVSVIALYEVYKFIMMGHPQARFPILEHDDIYILNCANSEDQAKDTIFSKIQQLVTKSVFFGPYIDKITALQISFFTPHDKETNIERAKIGLHPVNGTIICKCGHSQAGPMLGRTIATIIIDEMAAMVTSKGESGNDEDLYEMLKPSLATFGNYGKMICISNPLGPQGKFYDLYNNSFIDDTMLMIQLPTWKCNPNVEKAFLESQRLKSPETYMMQYGAEFGVAGTTPYFPKEAVLAAFERGKYDKRKEYGEVTIDYFAHLDPATSSDNYTMVILHLEPTQDTYIDTKTGKKIPHMMVVVDHIMIWRPKKNFKINIDIVDDYVIKMSNQFNLRLITYDQWNSQGSINKMLAYGLNTKATPFSREYQELIFTELYQKFINNHITIYANDTIIYDPELKTHYNLNESTEARKQLIGLQRVFERGRYKAEAMPGVHDDICDCIAGATYQALNYKSYSRLPRPITVYWR